MAAYTSVLLPLQNVIQNRRKSPSHKIMTIISNGFHPFISASSHPILLDSNSVSKTFDWIHVSCKGGIRSIYLYVYDLSSYLSACLLAIYICQSIYIFSFKFPFGCYTNIQKWLIFTKSANVLSNFLFLFNVLGKWSKLLRWWSLPATPTPFLIL